MSSHFCRLLLALSFFNQLKMSGSSSLKRYQHGSGPHWALVTGSTNGMGFEWARQLAALGFSLLLHGRSAEKLETTRQSILDGLPSGRKSEVQIRPVVADAGANPPQLAELEAILSEGGLDLRVVVNNIGITNEEYPRFEDTSDEELIKMATLNMVFPSLVAKKTLPLLKKSQPSLMVNVSSLGAWAPSP